MWPLREKGLSRALAAYSDLAFPLFQDPAAGLFRICR